jgi:hypothetical protein
MSTVDIITHSIQKMVKQVLKDTCKNLSSQNQPIFHEKPKRFNSPNIHSNNRLSKPDRGILKPSTKFREVKKTSTTNSLEHSYDSKKPELQNKNAPKFKNARKFKNSQENSSKMDSHVHESIVNAIIAKIMPQFKKAITTVITQTENHIASSSDSLLQEIRDIWKFNQEMSERLKVAEKTLSSSNCSSVEVIISEETQSDQKSETSDLQSEEYTHSATTQTESPYSESSSDSQKPKNRLEDVFWDTLTVEDENGIIVDLNIGTGYNRNGYLDIILPMREVRHACNEGLIDDLDNGSVRALKKYCMKLLRMRERDYNWKRQ